MKKRNIILLICLFVIIFIFGKTIYNRLITIEEPDIEPNNIILTDFEVIKDEHYINEYFIIHVGEKLDLNFSFTPTKVSEYQKRFTWTNSDNTVVNVSNTNVVTGLKVGTVILIATSTKNNDLSKTIKVRVVEESNSLEFDNHLLNKKLIYSIGELVKLNTITTGMVSVHPLIWTSSNPEIATIDNGYLKGVSMGKTTIQAVSQFDTTIKNSLEIEIRGKYTVTKDLKIEFENIVGVKLPTYEVNIPMDTFLNERKEIGYIITFNAKSNNNQALDTFFTFDNPDMVRILSNENSQVIFKCLKPGLITVNAHSVYFSDISSSLTFDVMPIDYKDSFKLINPNPLMMYENNDKKIYEIALNDIEQIKVEYNNSLIDYTNLNIHSSNTDVISIDNGYLLTKSLGLSDIIISDKFNDNYSHIFTIKVINERNDYFPIKLINYQKITINDKSDIIKNYLNNKVYPTDIVKIDFSCYPIYASFNDDFIIRVDNQSIVDLDIIKNDSIYSIIVNFLSVGEVNLDIICVSNNELNESFTFTVINKNEVSFDYTPVKILERGQTGNPNVSFDSSLTNISIEYISSNPEIASIGINGDICGIMYGKSTISIIVTDSFTRMKKSFDIEIVHEKTLFDDLSIFKPIFKYQNKEINLNEQLFHINDTFTLNIDYLPTTYLFSDMYEVIIDDPNVIEKTYENKEYKFKLLKTGSCNLTIKPYGNTNLLLSYKVTVINVMPEFLFVDLPNQKLLIGDKYQLGYLVDWRATYQNVDIKVNNEDIAYIEKDYLIIKNVGKTDINFIIDDHDDNTVNYTYSLPIETFNQSLSVRIARYGYLNLFIRLITQILSCMGLALCIYLLTKIFRLNIFYQIIINGSILLIIGLSFFIRNQLSILFYEQYDVLINLCSYLFVVIIIFFIQFIRLIKERKHEVNS